MHPTKTIREMLTFINGKPLDPEEWFAIFKKWEKEMTISQAAIYLGISKNEVSKISGPKFRKIERTRHGHVSTQSVYAYREELCCIEQSKHESSISQF